MNRCASCMTIGATTTDSDRPFPLSSSAEYYAQYACTSEKDDRKYTTQKSKSK
jgi:hypothetical protein